MIFFHRSAALFILNKISLFSTCLMILQTEAFADISHECLDPQEVYNRVQSSYTVDGGESWSAVQLVYDPFPDLTQHGLSNGIQNDNSTSNNVVVILPKNNHRKSPHFRGDWLNFSVRNYVRPGATDAQCSSRSFR